MPKISGKVLKTAEKDGKFAAWIQLNGKLPKVGEFVTVKWGKTRSLSQNAFYWVFLSWLMNDAGLKDEYESDDVLHETFKAAFLSKRHITPTGEVILKIGSTTNLGKLEFGEYMEKVNKAMIEWNGIDTSQFWKEYQLNYQC